jgi:proteasome lid subunit RPN8/RPN11
MSKKKHKHKQAGGQPVRSVIFYGPVLQNIRQHARRSPHAEICGVLIGRQGDGGTTVTGSVPGEGAAQGGAHVTFTQEAWVRIHEEKDRKYSGQSIVGWYHSHPGFGVFLSDHDTFIHKNFLNP